MRSFSIFRPEASTALLSEAALKCCRCTGRSELCQFDLNVWAKKQPAFGTAIQICPPSFRCWRQIFRILSGCGRCSRTWLSVIRSYAQELFSAYDSKSRETLEPPAAYTWQLRVWMALFLGWIQRSPGSREGKTLNRIRHLGRPYPLEGRRAEIACRALLHQWRAADCPCHARSGTQDTVRSNIPRGPPHPTMD